MPQAAAQAELGAGEGVLGSLVGALHDRREASALVVCDGMPEELVAITVQVAEHDGFRRRARHAGLLHGLAELLAELSDTAVERCQQRDAVGRGRRRAELPTAQLVVAQAKDAAQCVEQRWAALNAGGGGGQFEVVRRKWLQQVPDLLDRTLLKSRARTGQTPAGQLVELVAALVEIPVG